MSEERWRSQRALFGSPWCIRRGDERWWFGIRRGHFHRRFRVSRQRVATVTRRTHVHFYRFPITEAQKRAEATS